MNDDTIKTRRFGIRGAIHDYSGTIVLRGVDFELQSGEVHALLGENGSGKSTLIKILTGALHPAAGQIYLDDEQTSFGSPARAQVAGIGFVHQNYNIFPDLSVEKNVVGTSPATSRRPWLFNSLDHGKMRNTVLDLFDQLHIDIDPSVPLRLLGPAERKFVEIARAMTVAPQFLILDEPTASLEPAAARRVLELLRTLRAQGVGIAFVSHRLDEVLAVADQYTVLRDGRSVAQGRNTNLDEAALASMMIGDRASAARARSTAASSQVRMMLRDLRVVPSAPPASLDVRHGEVLGVTGLVGSGATALVQMIGGAIPLRGELVIDGRRAAIGTPRLAQRHGIGYIPEDRKAAGLISDQSVALNISLASLGSVSQRGVMSFRRLGQRAQRYREQLDIRLTSVDSPVSSLSGGNQQKVMIAKLLASGVDIMAIEEPTQGVDIGGKAQIHDLLRDFAEAGGTVVLASTDVREVVAICDRIAIFRHGALQELLDVEQFDAAHVTLRGASDAEHFLAALVDVDETNASRAL